MQAGAPQHVRERFSWHRARAASYTAGAGVYVTLAESCDSGEWAAMATNALDYAAAHLELGWILAGEWGVALMTDNDLNEWRAAR